MSILTIAEIARQMWVDNLVELAKYDPTEKEMELFATEMLWQITADLNRWIKEDIEES